MTNALAEKGDSQKIRMNHYNPKVAIITLGSKEVSNIYSVINNFTRNLHYLDKKLKVFIGKKEKNLY